MRRIILILLTLTASLSTAQAAQQLGGAPLPPSMVAPTPSVSPGPSPSFNVSTTRMGRPVLVPSLPSNLDTFSNRVQICMAAGAAAGLSPGGVGGFTRSCAN